MTAPTVVTTVTPPAPLATTNRRVPAAAAALSLLAAATVLINLVLPDWAYPLCGLMVAAALLGVARWSGLRLHAVGLARRHLRRAAVFGLGGLVAPGPRRGGVVRAVARVSVVRPDAERHHRHGLGGVPVVAVSVLTMLAAALGGVLLHW
jgi:hypothetical protein